MEGQLSYLLSISMGFYTRYGLDSLSIFYVFELIKKWIPELRKILLEFQTL